MHPLSFPVIFTTTALCCHLPHHHASSPRLIVPLVLIYNFSSTPVPRVHSPTSSLFLTKKIRPRNIRRRITATRTTITMAHGGNESLFPVSPMWRCSCEPSLFWCSWLLLPGASDKIGLSFMLDVGTVKEPVGTGRIPSDIFR